ncbi:hypothetical protein KXV69_004252 [Aspergillus fumigatus]|nr:hypothetical protein KXV69_004252 [Aspergillus fumigatus]
MPASVEADGHVRVAASVPVDGARLSGADKGARAPANWSPLAPPVSVWVSLDPVSVPGARRPTGHPRCLRVCRSASVCPWRAPLPAGGRPAQGAPANWSPCRPPARRPPPRQLGQPTGRRALACAPPPPPPPRPPRPPRPPFVALARATLCSPRGRAPTGGEAHLRRQTARRPCGHVPQPTGHCPSSPGGGGARVPAAISAGQLARVHGGGDPEGTGRHRCPPASPEKGVWAPLQAPGAAGPVDGRCLPTNLAKDRADAQRLVATRLLDRLHDPLGHFSRLQRIHPRAR